MGFFPPFTALFPVFAENAGAVQQTTGPQNPPSPRSEPFIFSVLVKNL